MLRSLHDELIRMTNCDSDPYSTGSTLISKKYVSVSVSRVRTRIFFFYSGTSKE
jgi:hypothetical protein